MTEDGFKRKLAAILSADVEGYSLLMDQDEEGTIRSLKSFRAAMTDLILQYRGRVVDSPGDNLLAEFTSVVDAVNCAVEVQREFAERNAELPENRRMQFRIGVNLGDVVDDKDRIYGEGVNIAARVESMAEAGGICITGRAYDQVANKLGLEYENLGEHRVKNISTPIRVYRILSYPGAAAHRVIKAKGAVGRKWRKVATVLAMMVLLAVGFSAWNFYFRSLSVETASLEKMAYPLPDKPSIAVLPFDNLSDDNEQEYFSDGITDDLITDLSKVSGLFVVARNSTFSYKGKHKKVQLIAEDLGVRYVLEGSVRKHENKVRINAQLIDALTGGHVWAERYDRDFQEIFELQDEVINKIVAVLSVKLTEGEKDLISIQKTVNMKAYDYYLRGMNLLHILSAESLLKSKIMFEKAIKNDPDFSHAYAAHAMANQYIYRLKLPKAGISPREASKQAYEYVNKALKLNPKLPAAYSVLGSLELVERNFDEAIEYSQKAVSLDPNDPEGYVVLGYLLTKAGKHHHALETIQKAFRLNPIPPQYYFYYLGNILVQNRQYHKAVESIKKAGPDTPLAWRYELLICYVYLGDMDKAENEFKIIAKGWPRVNIAGIKSFTNFKEKSDQDLWIEAFRKMGTPEFPFAYKGDENNILSKEEILDLIVDKTLTGIDPDKGQVWFKHSEDGTYKVTGAYDNFGKYSFDGDQLCLHSKKYAGYVDYIFFYRNPGGTIAEKNEYHMFFPFLGTLPVSVEK